MMPDPVISEAELFAEIDRLAVKPPKRYMEERLYNLVDRGRNKGMTWDKLYLFLIGRNLFPADKSLSALKCTYLKEKSLREHSATKNMLAADDDSMLVGS